MEMMMKMNGIVSGRKHSFNVILPKRGYDYTDDELRLMLVTLKNAIVAGSVHISKIENELRKRKVDSRILSATRQDLMSRIEIDDYTGDEEWRMRLKEDNSVAA
jgi:hypothetical protein